MHIVDCAREGRSASMGGRAKSRLKRQNPADTIVALASQRSPENTSGRDCVVVFCFCLLAIFKDTYFQRDVCQTQRASAEPRKMREFQSACTATGTSKLPERA